MSRTGRREPIAHAGGSAVSARSLVGARRRALGTSFYLRSVQASLSLKHSLSVTVLSDRLRIVTDHQLGDMTLTAILDNPAATRRVLRRMIPVFHIRIALSCPGVVLPQARRILRGHCCAQSRCAAAAR